MMLIQRVKYKDIEQPTFNFKKEFKSDFQGSGQAPFIGRFGYPLVNIGILAPQLLDKSGIYDNPKEWISQKYPIQKIAGLRSDLVNSRQKNNIHDQNRLIEIVQEIGMASQPVDLEVNLKEKPKINFNPEKEVTPFGPVADIKKIRITENTKINPKVEKIVSATDLKAVKGIWELYQKGLDENFLSKLISVGNLGLKNNRKLVPTRWSITAIDDSLGKQLLTEIKQLPIGDYQLYFGGEWGNYYLMLFFPEIWSYELFEMYLDKKINPWSQNHYAYSTDYEGYENRKTYAQECAGGYYAARLPVLEKMKENRKQNSVLVLRFISPEYNIPLGVFVCREASRKALTSQPLKFSTKELMLKYAQELIKNKFGWEINDLLKESKLLKEMKQQKKISEY